MPSRNSVLPSRLSSRLIPLLCLSLPWFTLAHLLLFWQVWTDPCHLVPGPIGDNTVMLWNLGWVRYALDHGSSGFWFPNAYYPSGFLFLFGTHTWLDGVLGWMAAPVLPSGPEGIVLWANIVQLLATTLTGAALVFGMWQWGARRPGVLLLAATAVDFCWFRMFAATGHYHFFGTEWMVISLALLSAGRRRLLAGFNHATAWFVTAGCFLGLTLLNDQTMFVFACLLSVPIWLGLIRLRCSRRRSSWKTAFPLRPLLCFWGVAFLISLVQLVPLVMAILDGKFHYEVAMYREPRLVDMTSLFLPNQRHWFSSIGLARLREQWRLTWSEGTYFGLVGMILFLVACTGAWKGARAIISRKPSRWRKVFWIQLCTLLFLLLALGDRLKIGSHLYFLLPGYLLHDIPIINNIRIPQRFVWPAHLCNLLAASLTLCLSSGRMTAWWKRHARRGFRTAAALTLALAALAEGKWYPPARPVDIRDPFLKPTGAIEAVKSAYHSGGVLTMPMEYAYGHSNVFQFFWGYDIPITTAYTARAPFDVTHTPWHGTQWTPESAEWLRKHHVRIIIFSFEGGDLPEYQSWIAHAKSAVPGLVVFNRNGKRM